MMTLSERKKLIKKLDTKPTLFDLLDIRGYGNHDFSLLLQHINSGEISMGSVWENVLTEFMPFTEKTKLNTKAMDWTDGTDAKFSMSSIDNTKKRHRVRVTGFANKTGTLRVCFCSRQDNYKLYFMLVPEHIYSTFEGVLPAMEFHLNSDGEPTGSSWSIFKHLFVPFSEVIKDCLN